MSKNYAEIHGSDNASIALEQRFYVKEEVTRGTLKAPTGGDYLFTLGGGNIEFTQPFESSPHRSGRHHTSIIKKKKEANFTFSTYFNINTALGAAGVTEIDPAVRTLFKSLLGAEDTSSGLLYTPSIPNLTFSLFECGDKWARQMRGAFIQGGNLQFPGDGEATVEWTGSGKDAIYLGIGRSEETNAGGNTVTLMAGEGEKFKKGVGGLVMIVKADGLTRSTDTPDGTPRIIQSVLGDVITLSGAALTADSDGTALNPVFLCYYEPETPAAINDPQTGLVGSMAITGIGSICARSIGLNITNDHELVNYCYGSDSLSSPFYVPGNRLTAEVSFETNLNDAILKFFNAVENFEAQELQLVLGDPAGRRLQIDIPKVFFPIPSVAVPDSGSIPVTFTGNCYQSALDAADEVSIHFK